jgi:hypothetical protein
MQVFPPPPIVAVAGWVIPGAGYVMIGQRARGVTIGVTILALFVMGLLIGGIRVVDSPPGYTPYQILQKPWFIPQVLAGPVTIVTTMIGHKYDPKDQWISTARVNEIGTLYTAIAGLLNLMAIIDSSFRAGNRGER